MWCSGNRGKVTVIQEEGSFGRLSMNWRWRRCSSQAAVMVLLLVSSADLGWAPPASAQDAAAKTSQQTPAAKDPADQPSADEQFKIQSNVQYVTTPVTVF